MGATAVIMLARNRAETGASLRGSAEFPEIIAGRVVGMFR